MNEPILQIVAPVAPRPGPRRSQPIPRWLAGACRGWILAGAIASAQAAVTVLDAARLAALRQEALQQHPGIAAAGARVAAAEAAVRSIPLWEDPTVGVGYRAAGIDRRRDDGDVAFSADQPLPRPRLHAARQAVASAERSVLQAEQRQAVVDLGVEVGRLALEVALADESRRIQSQQVQWLERLVQLSRSRLRDPEASVATTLRLEGELAREQQAASAIGARRESLARQLDTVLGRGGGGAPTEWALPEVVAEVPSLEAELARLAAANPGLQARRGSADAARAAVEVARRESRPVFSVGADTSVYAGGRFVETMLLGKVTLPWFNRSTYRANRERAEHAEVAAGRDREALERRLRGEVQAVHADAVVAAQQARRIREEVLPRVDRASVATESAWMSDRASLGEVFEARRASLTARLEERQQVAAQLVALESLRGLVPSSHP